MKTLKTALIVISAARVLAVGGTAGANSIGGGESPYAPGQGVAHDRCDAVKVRQEAMGLVAGGGPKSWSGEAPTPCDHLDTF